MRSFIAIWRSTVLAFLSIAIIFVFTSSVSSSAYADIKVKDYLNRLVVLKKPAKRIVALAPHIVENLFSAGAGHTLVGVVDYSDYPAQALKIPRIGAISAFSVEKIVALNPDLVIVWMSGGGGKVLPQLEALGITTYANDPHTLEDVARSITDYGKLTNAEAVATQTAAQFDKKLALLRQKYGKLSPVSVLYQVWYQPLQTLNDQHIISDVIRLCGGVNIFGDALTLAPKIGIESVIERDPQVIIASGMGQARPDWLNNWKQWPGLKAVKNQHLYFVSPNIIQRHTVRILDGAALMCQRINQARLKLVSTQRPPH